MTEAVQNTDSRRITITLLGTQVIAEEVEPELINHFGAIRYRDAYYIKFNGSDAWLFEYGVLVSWNQTENDRQQLVLRLAPIIEDYIRRSPIEQYAYRIIRNHEFSIHNDVLILPEQNRLISLALSHAFAQAAKLEFFEDKAGSVIQKNAHISKQLARTGKVPLSRRNLAKLRGVLFDTSSDITLHFNLLDTPEFFWDYPEQEALYQKLAKYLDLTPRIEILNKKLETIQRLLSMLASEQHHKHSAFLEWIIIILIAVEIVLYFFE
ncbi:MAG: RMD1 family protein [Deltaproteobacteria bacterium]|nr:RMD1 family protein [Deltaproteobacteria bacterium]MBN2673875.1 RMD1 family protein [Deltaproteobacteria bacterium]